MRRSADQAIAVGIAALVRMQATDGSFPLRTRKLLGRWAPCGPLFATACVLLAAGWLLPAQAVERGVDFLRRSRRPDGLWEFDPALCIPPDSDSTSCALAALALHGGAHDLEGGAGLLRSFWRPDAGPFRTWRVGGMWSESDRDDAVVNCNVVFALDRLGTPPTPAELVAVRGLMQRSVRGSRYYCAPSAITYAAARAGLPHDALPPVASARPPTQDLLGCAQWLRGTSQHDAQLIAAVLAAQRRDGAWPLRPWCTGVGTPTPAWGSAAVSTALALEALTSGEDTG